MSDARYEAVLLDFYGTLVEEDTAVIAQIVRRIADGSPRRPSTAEVSGLWGRRFAALCAESRGNRFETQRAIELASLRGVLEHYGSPLDPGELSAELFAYWVSPNRLDGAEEFLRGLRVPVCLVSNIDTSDLGAAVSRLGWAFSDVVTGQDCRAYKPRAEPFMAALTRLGCAADRVLHVGDSLRSDVLGASALGIPVAWVNPQRRSLPTDLGAAPRYVVSAVSDLASVIG